VSQLHLVYCTNCQKELIFHSPRKEEWICYYCGYNLDPLKEEEKNE